MLKKSSMSHMAASKQAAGSPAMNLLMLPAAMLSEVLARLPARTRVLTMPLVSRALLALVEEDCELLCESHGWVLPRRPRGIGADSTRHPYRRLYLSKSCVCCIAVGDFCVSTSSHVGALAVPASDPAAQSQNLHHAERCNLAVCAARDRRVKARIAMRASCCAVHARGARPATRVSCRIT